MVTRLRLKVIMPCVPLNLQKRMMWNRVREDSTLQSVVSCGDRPSLSASNRPELLSGITVVLFCGKTK